MTNIESLISIGQRLADVALNIHTAENCATVIQWRKATDEARREAEAVNSIAVRLYEAFDAADIGHRTPAQRSAMLAFRSTFRRDDGENWTRREEA